MYSFSLASQNCCPPPQTIGLPGPTGPAGIGPIGPVGYTGLPGVSFTGPTGQGCTGPTGPPAPFSGVTGPMGPTGSSSSSVSVIPITYTPNSPLTLPLPSAPVSYYSVVVNGDITEIDATNLPSGYQAVLFVSASMQVSLMTSINLSYNLFSNIVSNVNLSPTSPAIITILSDGTNYYAKILLTTTLN